MIKIAVDAIGGDNAPEAIIEGAFTALAARHDICIELYGDEEIISPLIDQRRDATGGRISVKHAPDSIGFDESPVMAVRKKPNSSIVKGMMSLKEGGSDAFISAGSTGALLACGMFRLGRLQNIERPALATLLPTRAGKPAMLIDCGANADCRAEYLVQFGLMGSVYMEKVAMVENPRVALINIGSEAEKGNELAKKAHQLMLEADKYNFIGNIESRDLLTGDADVLVCDGFSGNLLLKYTEGFASSLMGIIKDELMSSFKSKIGALLSKGAFSKVKKRMDYSEYGGAPLLGLVAPVIKAHGSSNQKAIANAIRQALIMHEGRVIDTIKDHL